MCSAPDNRKYKDCYIYFTLKHLVVCHINLLPSLNFKTTDHFLLYNINMLVCSAKL